MRKLALLVAMLALVLAVAIPAIAQQAIEQGVEPASGDVALTYKIDNSGNYAHQCVPALQFGQTGNFDNSPAILQYGGRSGAIEPEGVQLSDEPTIDANCESTTQQSSAASG